jgi:cobalt/nickel transport system permease protein
MHVPDGFLSPVTWIPAAAVAGGATALAARRARRTFGARSLPRLAVGTALAFGLGSVTIPIPGGTSVHATGVALLTTQFGIAPAYLALTGVLALQATLFGVGGVTALGVNALCIGGAGALAAALGARALRPAGRAVSLFGAGWLSSVAPAVLLAFLLGLQPRLGTAPDGSALWFPFGWAVTFPAFLVPGAIVGVAEGALTWAATRFLDRLDGRVS